MTGDRVLTAESAVVPDGTALQRLFRARRPAEGEVCELCSQPIAAEHGHVVNVKARALLCACRACYLLFMHEGAGGAMFRAVPDRYARVDTDAATAVWSALSMPVGLAFFFVNSQQEAIPALYPSPAGATEAEVPRAEWDELVRLAPAVGTLAPDVEALLVRRQTPEGPWAAFIVPIDACYELVGRLRREWRGFQGGAAWAAVDEFFARVDARAREARP